MQAFLLLEIAALPKVVLLNGDTCSKQMGRCNRISYPLTGDAGSVTVIERCEAENPIYMDVKNDGSRHKAIMIPAGAYRMPSTPETLKLREVEEGVIQSLEHIHMDGAAIFNFTMEDVPPQIEEILAFSGNTRDSIEHFLFHQPNPFILKQMADKMKIPQAKLPNNIVSLYGNCSSVTIPLNIALNCGEQIAARVPARMLFRVWCRADLDFDGHGSGAAGGLQDCGLRINLTGSMGETYTLITGAASGFGRSIAQKLAPSRKLLLADINAEKLEAARKNL